MAINTRVTQDRRNISRLPARLSCEFSLEGENHIATIINISMKGALLSSKYMPPKGSPVTVALKSPALKTTVRLDGTVVRGTWGISDHGKIARFGIRFDNNAPDMIRVLNQLSKSYR